MDADYRQNESLVEVINKIRENFIKEHGRLLTEQEAVELTEEIRKDLKSGAKN